MFELIERIRQKPDSSKKRIALSVAFGFTMIIFIIWLSVVYPDFKDTEDRNKRVAEIKEVTPISNVSTTFSSGFSGIKDQFKSIIDSLKSFSTSPEYYSASSTQNQIKP